MASTIVLTDTDLALGSFSHAAIRKRLQAAKLTPQSIAYGGTARPGEAPKPVAQEAGKPLKVPASYKKPTIITTGWTIVVAENAVTKAQVLAAIKTTTP